MCLRTDFIWVYIKSNCIFRQAERIHARLGIVQCSLQSLCDRGQLLQLGHRSSVNLLDSLVTRISILFRQHCVAHHPVHHRTNTGSCGPMIDTPVTLGLHRGIPLDMRTPFIRPGLLEMRPTRIIARLVVPPPGQIQYLLAGSRQSRCCCCKFALIHIVDLHRFAQHCHCLSSRRPGEIGIRNQLIIPLQGSEVVSVCISMTLRIHTRRIRRINVSIQVLPLVLLYVVVERIDNLSRINATSVVPEHFIVHRACLDTGLHKVVPASQQSQFLL